MLCATPAASCEASRMQLTTVAMTRVRIFMLRQRCYNDIVCDNLLEKSQNGPHKAADVAIRDRVSVKCGKGFRTTFALWRHASLIRPSRKSMIKRWISANPANGRFWGVEISAKLSINTYLSVVKVNRSNKPGVRYGYAVWLDWNLFWLATWNRKEHDKSL